MDAVVSVALIIGVVVLVWTFLGHRREMRGMELQATGKPAVEGDELGIVRAVETELIKLRGRVEVAESRLTGHAKTLQDQAELFVNLHASIGQVRETANSAAVAQGFSFNG